MLKKTITQFMNYLLNQQEKKILKLPLYYNTGPMLNEALAKEENILVGIQCMTASVVSFLHLTIGET